MSTEIKKNIKQSVSKKISPFETNFSSHEIFFSSYEIFFSSREIFVSSHEITFSSHEVTFSRLETAPIQDVRSTIGAAWRLARRSPFFQKHSGETLIQQNNKQHEKSAHIQKRLTGMGVGGDRVGLGLV